MFFPSPNLSVFRSPGLARRMIWAFVVRTSTTAPRRPSETWTEKGATEAGSWRMGSQDLLSS